MNDVDWKMLADDRNHCMLVLRLQLQEALRLLAARDPQLTGASIGLRDVWRSIQDEELSINGGQ